MNVLYGNPDVYVSPELKFFEMSNEGVLCSSEEGFASGIDNVTETDFIW